MRAVFCDLDQTLGSLILDPDLEVESIVPYPRALDSLRQDCSRQCNIGLVVATAPGSSASIRRLIENSEIGGLVDSSLVFLSAARDHSGIELFGRARSMVSDPNPIFVSSDPAARELAAAAGFVLCWHPILVTEALAGFSSVWKRITVGPDRLTDVIRSLNEIAVVPAKIVMAPSGSEVQIFVVTSSRVSAGPLAKLALNVETIVDEEVEPVDALYLHRFEPQPANGLQFEDTFRCPALQGVDAGGEHPANAGVVFGFGSESEHGMHGHRERLIPDPSLYLPFTKAGDPSTPALHPKLPQSSTEMIARIEGESIRRHVEQYAGIGRKTDRSRRIRSRHVVHVDNQAAVALAVNDLSAAGNGLLDVKLHAYGDWQQTARQTAVRTNVFAELRGEDSTEHVIVSAHLDSTAGAELGYDPANDPAPGADDDSSGVAAVIEIAAAICRIHAATPLKRNLVFCLFNSEEAGLVGSNAFARMFTAQGREVVAVLQMDMIGYVAAEAPQRGVFESHAGYEVNKSIEARSKRLGSLLAALLSRVSPYLGPVEEYPGPGRRDPADSRSDHASFQQRGSPGCAFSENAFAAPPVSGSKAGLLNPNYHRSSDTEVDYDFAAGIARAVAATAVVAANH